MIEHIDDSPIVLRESAKIVFGAAKTAKNGAAVWHPPGATSHFVELVNHSQAQIMEAQGQPNFLALVT